jgi:tetratricopeptide (TPR) repeat protein
MATTGDVERYVALADQFRSELYGSDSGVWITRIDEEFDHLEGALRCLATGQRREDIEQALRVAGGLREYWWKRDKLREGREWLRRLLALPQAASRTDVRAQALDDGAVLAFYQEDYEDAISLLQESIAIRRELGDGESAVYSLLHLASIYRVGMRDVTSARATNQEALAVAQQHGIDPGIGYALSALGRVAIDEEEWPTARNRLHQSLRVLRKLGDSWALTIVLRHCALLAAATGAPLQALRLAAASAALQAGLGMTDVGADQALTDSVLMRARAALPAEEADAAWREGQGMTLERAVEYALQQYHLTA